MEVRHEEEIKRKAKKRKWTGLGYVCSVVWREAYGDDHVNYEFACEMVHNYNSFSFHINIYDVLIPF